MAEHPAFPLWTDAYLGDTYNLTTTEHGAYLLLLITMWRNKGSLPNDPKKLASWAKCTTAQWERVWPRLADFFTVAGDTITQGRLTDELSFVRRKRNTQSKNARARWLKNNDMGDATALPRQSHGNAPTPTPTVEEDKSSSTMSGSGPKKARKANGYPPEFEAVWLAYPRTPTMSKAKTHEAWRRLDDDDRAAAAAAVPKYVEWLAAERERKPDAAVMHFTTFINERRFEGFNEVKTNAPRVVTEEQWGKRLDYGRKNNRWHINWGPRPGQDDCTVPIHLLQQADGQGWERWEG